MPSSSKRRSHSATRRYHTLKETEVDFQRSVLKAADGAGWYRHHDSNTQARYPLSDKGFPDLVLARDGRIIFAELKKDRKAKPDQDQQIWLNHLRGSDILGSRDGAQEVYVWTPDDWD